MLGWLTGDTGEVGVARSDDTGVIERPRDIAVSTSHQQLQPRSSLRGGVASEGGSRSLRGASEAGSSSLTHCGDGRRMSPDHIPRLHECWSLEPVRRATQHRDRDRSACTMHSDLSSLDSLPQPSTQPPHQQPHSTTDWPTDWPLVMWCVDVKWRSTPRWDGCVDKRRWNICDSLVIAAMLTKYSFWWRYLLRLLLQDKHTHSCVCCESMPCY